MADTPQQVLEQAKTALMKAQEALAAAEKIADAGGAAVHAATGKRLRSLPIDPGALKSA